jgi:hypothetical protein
LYEVTPVPALHENVTTVLDNTLPGAGLVSAAGTGAGGGGAGVTPG